jgi:4-hydroxythreonine-4-phosphate dehydrogenase
MRPIVGVTMGDAAGIGPEIVAKALSIREIHELCRPIVIGDAHVIEEIVGIIGVDARVNSLHDIGEAKSDLGTINVLDLSNIDLRNLRRGKLNAMAGKAAVQYVEKAVRLALDGKIHAIATAPINKEAINMAGFQYAGHTELLAHLTNTKNYAMMLIVGSLRVVHVTTHVSMRRACDMIRKNRVLDVIRLAYEALLGMGTERPRIAVASFNPHGGEGGLFGAEEIEEIKPAVDLARSEGLDVLGPLPADTVFVKARGGAYDAVVAMYHDQGHIPVKLLGLEWDEKEGRWTSVAGINVTIGIPIIRSSVDHGTAFGKAWKGYANPQSMIEAIRFAARVSLRRIPL